MQILINGEERFYSKKEPYMKSPLLTRMNEEGFELKLVFDKRVDAGIQSLSITELGGAAGIIHGEIPPILKPFVNHMRFKMTVSDFAGARRFICTVNELAKQNQQ